MDTVVLLAIVVAVIVVLYFLLRRTPSEGPAPRPREETVDYFDFAEDTQSVAPLVKRTTRIAAPRQIINGTPRRLQVTAQPQVALLGVVPYPGKGVDKLIDQVINPSVRIESTNQELYEFDPPLTVTISYRGEDAQATTNDENGKPRLSIVTGYEGEYGWRWERLNTVVTPDPYSPGGTLTAEVQTLHPADPMFIGAP